MPQHDFLMSKPFLYWLDLVKIKSTCFNLESALTLTQRINQRASSIKNWNVIQRLFAWLRLVLWSWQLLAVQSISHTFFQGSLFTCIPCGYMMIIDRVVKHFLGVFFTINFLINTQTLKLSSLWIFFLKRTQALKIAVTVSNFAISIKD